MWDTGASAVIFDLDGVLVDSRLPITSCINHALAANGYDTRPARQLYTCIGPPLGVAFSDLVGEPVDSERVEACVAAYRSRYAEVSLRQTEAVPGIHAVLARLAVDRPLAVATSKPLAFARPLLTALGLDEFFAAVAGPDLAARIEDKSATVGQALSALGNPSAVMVGDRSFDVVGATAQGLPTIGVTWGIGSRRELVSAGAVRIVDDPRDLAWAVRDLCER